MFQGFQGYIRVQRRDTGVLDEDVIGKYSAKIETVLRCIQESDGIVFIYTNWIASGVVRLY